ncbi:MAG: molybdopterin-dependent oxidoreductase [Propionibacteriales bacterium]|nr:molybdopterin-dependent oxidoreductase [Propionibacteriales bacterium]
MTVQQKTMSRRGFLKAGGALVVMTTAVPATLRMPLAKAAAAGAPFPAIDPGNLATWLAIKADGSVVARSGHVELGQGNRTALAQMVAEELDAAFTKVSMVLGDTSRTPDQGITAGSTTIRMAGIQLRQMAAEGRAALLDLASQRLGTPVERLSVKDGVVSDGSTQVDYGELVKGRVLTAVAPIKVTGSGASWDLVIDGTARPKNPSEYSVVGQRIPRLDIPDKVTGKATYIQDVRVDGMLHARVIHPEAIGSEVVSVGRLPSDIRGAQVVRKHNLVAVLAEREWDAIKGARALSVEWSRWAKLPPSKDAYQAIRSMRDEIMTEMRRGDVRPALASAARTLEATYQTPFENHGMIGPSCAVAEVRPDGSATIWSSTQYPQGLQRTIAEVLETSPEQVEVLWVEGPGCYGRECTDDAGPEAAILSKEVGRPVRVQWTREDEHIYEPHGPGTVHDMRAGVDADGNVVAWEHEAWMPPNNDARPLGPALAGRPVETEWPLGGWSGDNLYTFPTSHEFAHALRELGAADAPFGMGLRTNWLRSPGQYQISYAQEAFVDEVAAEVRQDPLRLRVKYLDDPRAIAVLEAVGKAAGWESRPSPKPGSGTSNGTVTGQGIAFVLRDGTYAAGVAKVEVNPDTGKVRVLNFTVAQDAGLIINPLAVEHQLESAVLQTVSRAMLEEVTFDASNVTSTDWSSYPILTMADSPEVKTVLLNRPEIPPAGVGEASVNVIAPAISSAIHDATGVRIRTLPLKPDAVKSALKAEA